ncbi:MAG: hypothetical protein LBV69_01205 [Bacteroidales bacterium]|nr:hypothetical protein [Bacteroidales bacterium]
MIEEVQENLYIAVNNLLSDKEKIKSITEFKLILEVIQGCMIADWYYYCLGK